MGVVVSRWRPHSFGSPTSWKLLPIASVWSCAVRWLLESDRGNPLALRSGLPRAVFHLGPPSAFVAARSLPQYRLSYSAVDSWNTRHWRYHSPKVSSGSSTTMRWRNPFVGNPNSNLVGGFPGPLLHTSLPFSRLPRLVLFQRKCSTHARLRNVTSIPSFLPFFLPSSGDR